MTSSLERLADLYGIEPGYVSESGEYKHTSDDTRRALLAAMGVRAESQEEVERALAAAPPPRPHDPFLHPGTRAFRPEWLETTRVWGLTCQLYGLVSSRNWGMGDFEDLARLCEIAAAHGADFLGVNPLHALFAADPTRFSPYAPSDRQFLNPLYIAPDMVPEFAQVVGRIAPVLDELPALRRMPLIDYPAVARVKAKALTALYGVFRRLPQDHPRRVAFAAFRERCGEALERFALFEAISQHFATRGVGAAWSQWPPAWRDHGSTEVADFAHRHKDNIAFYAWLQWLAKDQLKAAQTRARAAGMRIGLYLDLAVGVAPDGAATWADPHLAIAGAEIGAPPDPLAAGGQQWGLAPLSPARLCETGFERLRQVLSATMYDAGAVRIDHAMGLQRLFWIPAGRKAADGAYVRYPVADMFGLVAQVSQQHRCLVVGEDLGTVPEGFRDRMREAGLFSYRVLYFERAEGGRFKQSGEHEPDSLVCVSTHDLPPLRGWWIGRDIEWRRDLGLVSEEQAASQRQERERDRALLLQALAREDLLPDGATDRGELSDALLTAVHLFIARSPCRLMAVQLDDALGAIEAPNVPGTSNEHPNWRRKAPVALEDIADQPLFAALTAALAAERRRP